MTKPSDFLPELFNLLERVYEAGRAAGPAAYPAPLPFPSTAPDHLLTNDYVRREPPSPQWIPVKHTLGEHPCGNAAFYLTRPFEKKEKADLSCMRIMPPLELQWREPVPADDDPQCSSCGRPINPYTRDDLDWGDALIDAKPNDPAKNPERAKRSKRRVPKAGQKSVTSPGPVFLGPPSEPDPLPIIQDQPVRVEFQEAMKNLRGVLDQFVPRQTGASEKNGQ